MSTEITSVKSLAEQQRDFVRWQLVGKDVTADEFEYFLQVAAHLGLDPLRKQVYCIKRKDKATVQIGIDGYRAIASRTGELAGIDDAEYGPLNAEGFPEWARVTVYRMVQGQRCPFTSTARWTEYRQINSNGALTVMWLKMGFLLLAKCAESLSLRKGFAAETSGLYTEEEMMQADNPPLPPILVNGEQVLGDQQEQPLVLPEGVPNFQEWASRIAKTKGITDKEVYVKTLYRITGKTHNFLTADYQKAVEYFYRMPDPRPVEIQQANEESANV